MLLIAVPHARQRLLRVQGEVGCEGVVGGSGLSLLSGHRGVRVATDCADDHARRWDVPNRVARERVPHGVVVGCQGAVLRTRVPWYHVHVYCNTYVPMVPGTILVPRNTVPPVCQ